LKIENKASVLIVDDDVGMNETLYDILTDLGYRVEVAKNGFEAMEKVRAQAFDVILMDIKMPGINGVETYKEIKRMRPEATVIMMTAYRQEMQELVEEAVRNNAYTCIYKPFDIEKVLRLIEEILARKTPNRKHKKEMN